MKRFIIIQLVGLTIEVAISKAGETLQYSSIEEATEAGTKDLEHQPFFVVPVPEDFPSFK